MERKVLYTSDGSSTIFIPEMDETYHSSHGAIQEARHVFLKYGIESIDKIDLKIFEMGFGTGLNALLSLQSSNEHNKNITYHSIEAFPVEMELIEKLNYVQEINPSYGKDFNLMHTSDWNKDVQISDRFTLYKIHAKIEKYTMPEACYDLIFFDAFGPRAQEKMWTVEILQKMYDGLVKGGMLVTYCAQGQFKRNLKMLGFEIEALPGPPGKREMTRAIKS